VKRNEVRLNTEAHRPARDQFVHHLNAVVRREGWRPHEAITTWLDAAFRATRSATLLSDRVKFDANEAAYMKIVHRCREPKESMADISAMLSALVLALEAAPVDFVGPVYEEFAASKHLGQTFTPYALSRLMAEMTLIEPERIIDEGGRGFITLQEPSCGVGGMTLAASEVLRDRGINVARQVHWTMIDVDYSATCAAYLQTNLCGISADVFHGNTLSLETWLSTRTLAAAMYPKHLPYHPKAKLPIEQLVKPTDRPVKPVQLSLFSEAAE
jgi:type I restriction-modification system DNA methylase subunit